MQVFTSLFFLERQKMLSHLRTPSNQFEVKILSNTDFNFSFNTSLGEVLPKTPILLGCYVNLPYPVYWWQLPQNLGPGPGTAERTVWETQLATRAFWSFNWLQVFKGRNNCVPRSPPGTSCRTCGWQGRGEGDTQKLAERSSFPFQKQILY